MWIPCYYAPEADGTIVSPTDISLSHKKQYSGYTYQCDLDHMKGSVKFIHRNGLDHAYFDMIMENGLWYAYEIYNGHNISQKRSYEVVRRLSKAAEYELWHQRLGHPGQKVMEMIHKKVHGVPKIRGNAFYRCASCCHGNLCERHVGESRKTMQDKDLNQNKNTIPLTDKGKHFAMDFGFVRGSEF